MNTPYSHSAPASIVPARPLVARRALWRGEAGRRSPARLARLRPCGAASRWVLPAPRVQRPPRKCRRGWESPAVKTSPSQPPPWGHCRPSKSCPAHPGAEARSALSPAALGPRGGKAPAVQRRQAGFRIPPPPQTHTHTHTPTHTHTHTGVSWQLASANVAPLLWGTLKETN